jgi:hypothetical protein
VEETKAIVKGSLDVPPRWAMFPCLPFANNKICGWPGGL